MSGWVFDDAYADFLRQQGLGGENVIETHCTVHGTQQPRVKEHGPIKRRFRRRRKGTRPTHSVYLCCPGIDSIAGLGSGTWEFLYVNSGGVFALGEED